MECLMWMICREIEVNGGGVNLTSLFPIQVGEKPINLSTGMAVTVEVKTGERRLIEYIFSQLMQYVSESIRER